MDRTDSSLRDREIAITGRMASMSRDDAIRAIRRAGGEYTPTPKETTALLVIGSDGPPLDNEGRPTQSLLRARELQSRGRSLEIIDEDAFITRLGLPIGDRLYTIAQLSRILDTPVAEIRSWMRHKLIQPVRVVKRLCYFDFRQVSSAKRLQQLARSGITLRRIHKSLEQLSDWLSDSPPSVAQLQVLARGGPLLVRLEDGRLAETNGQLQLDFEGGPASASTTEMKPRRPSAEEWFLMGISAEENGNPDGAIEAYQRALSLGEPQPEVCFNLGNTFYSLGRIVEAAASFARATEIDPEYVEAWNNLGNTLAEIGKPDEAVPAYRRALSIEPGYADAHYNLGDTLATLDDLSGARRHWQAYLTQDPNSPWATRIRDRLAELS